jgi:hypothetical protein
VASGCSREQLIRLEEPNTYKELSSARNAHLSGFLSSLIGLLTCRRIYGLRDQRGDRAPLGLHADVRIVLEHLF